MTTLKRATIRSYSPATHRASVQPADSLPTLLNSVPVATDIPAAEVVAGRECAVLLFDDNPDNAVVITIHGAVHASGSNFGDTTVNDQLAVGPSAAIQTGQYAYVANLGTVDGVIAFQAAIGAASTPTAGSIMGVAGRAIGKHASTTDAFGLDYVAGMSGLTMARAYGARTQAIATGSGKTLTDYFGFYALSGTAVLATLTNWHGFYVPALTLGTNRYPFFDAGTTASGNTRGNVFASSTQLFKTTLDLGGGDKVLGIADAATVPSTNPTGGGILYSQAGALKWRGSAGTVTTIAPA